MKFKWEYLNPFHEVMYRKNHPLPHSRTLHTVFQEKIEDTFGVLYRFFDYPTFLLSYLLNWLGELSYDFLVSSLYYKTEKYDLVLTSVKLYHEIDLNYIQEISGNNRTPVLVRQGDKIHVYGFSEGAWKLTDLGNFYPEKYKFIFPEIGQTSTLDKDDIQNDLLQKIAEKKGHLERGLKWLFFAGTQFTVALFYIPLFIMELIVDYLLRIPFAIILTIISWPVVLLVHIASKIAATIIEHHAGTIRVLEHLDDDFSDVGLDTTTITLQELLRRQKKDFPGLRVANVHSIEETQNGENVIKQIDFSRISDKKIVWARSIPYSNNDSRIKALAHTNEEIARNLYKKNFFGR